MSWGKQKKTRTSSKIGRPASREGADGDMQIRGTGTGAKLFAKWAGKWLGIHELMRDEQTDANIHSLKVWSTRIDSTGGAGDTLVTLPAHIERERVVDISLTVKTDLSGTDYVVYVTAGGSGDALAVYCMASAPFELKTYVLHSGLRNKAATVSIVYY